MDRKYKEGEKKGIKWEVIKEMTQDRKNWSEKYDFMNCKNCYGYDLYLYYDVC